MFRVTASHAIRHQHMMMGVLSFRAVQTDQQTMTFDKAQRSKYGNSWLLDPDKPWYHVMPQSGWLNDPNGPIFFKGKYHMCVSRPHFDFRWERSS